MNAQSFFEWRSGRYRLCTVPSVIETMEDPETVTIYLAADAKLVVSEGSRVQRAEPLCEKPDANSFASISGTVRSITRIGRLSGPFYTAVMIEGDGLSDQHLRLFDPVVDIDFADARLLRENLASVGFSLPAQGETLLVAALDTDIDHAVNRFSFEHDFPALETGLTVLKKILGNGKIVIALGQGSPCDKTDRCRRFGEVAEVPARYPDVMPQIVARRHASLRRLDRVKVIDGWRLAEMAAALSIGAAPVKTLLTCRVGRSKTPKLVSVAAGTAAGYVAQRLDTAIGGRITRIILGGVMGGEAADTATRTITMSHRSLFVDTSPTPSQKDRDATCVNCGRCVRVCPARLRVDLITAFVERSRPQDAIRLGIDHCIECGLCTAVCIRRRELGHLLAFGKSEGFRLAGKGSK